MVVACVVAKLLIMTDVIQYIELISTECTVSPLPACFMMGIVIEL